MRTAEAEIRKAWATITGWNIDTRYQVSRPHAEVLDFLDAVAGQKGVLRWLKQFW